MIPLPAPVYRLGLILFVAAIFRVPLDAQNVTPLWNFPTTPSAYMTWTPAISSDGTILVPSSDLKLYALNPNGTKKWDFVTGGYISSCPSIGKDGTVYVGSQDFQLYAVFPDGTKRWDYSTAGLIGESPAAIGEDSTVYVGSHDRKLHAVNNDGTRKWTFQTGGVIQAAPAIDRNGNIYITSGDGNLYCITTNGAKRWQSRVSAGIPSQPAFVSPTIGPDGTVYVALDTIFAINPDGSEKWSIVDWYAGCSVAIAADGTLFGSASARLFALDSDGTPKWSYVVGSVGSASPVLGKDGRLYFAANENGLFAFDGESPSAVAPWPMYGRTATHTWRASLASSGAPSIALQPVSQSAILNSAPYFLVAAEGSAPMAFQWYKGDSPIVGQTNSMLRLIGVRLSDSGEYSVTVNNEFGTVTSHRATLTVDPSIQVATYVGLTIEGEARLNCCDAA